MDSESDISPETHRKLAVDFFNQTWALLDKPDRTPIETDRMIHLAHASRLHWGYVGDAQNLSIGEWQIARVCAVVGLAESAEHHGRRALELAQQASLSPFFVAYGHEALARALARRDPIRAARHLASARAILTTLTDADERSMLETDLASIAIAE